MDDNDQNQNSTTKSPLPQEHVFQGVGTSNCGLACLEMVYRLKKKEVNVESLLQEFKFDTNGEDTYPAQIARNLLKNGVPTCLHISNAKVLPLEMKGKPSSELIAFLEDWLANNQFNDWFMYGLHLLFYLQAGGEIKIYSYGTNDMQNILESGSVMLLSVENTWLWGRRYRTIDGHPGIVDNINGKTSGHMVLVKSSTGEDFEVWDSYPGEEGVYHLPQRQVLNANLIWSATIIEAKLISN